MRYLNIMIKPASSLCNLRCKYCFYADVTSHRDVASYGLMDFSVAEKTLNNIFCDLEPGDRVNIAFQGGEPTLAGLPYFRHFIDYVDKVKNGTVVTYALQTNAVLIDAEWCEFLKRNSFLVGVSLDGPEKIHNVSRVDSLGNGTFRKVIAAIDLFKKYSVDFNVLMTLTSNLARHPNQVWEFIKEQDLRYVQFTPCLAPLDSTGKDVYAITPQRFSDFYSQIFTLWKKEFEAGNYFSVKLFDDLVNLIAFNRVNACGLSGRCTPQIVIEADGSVYPCDFYTLDKWCTGNFCESTISQIYSSPVYVEFLNRPRSRPLCSDCRYQRICNGACERMQSQICYPEDAKSCGYSAFLDATINDITEIARRERMFKH